MTSRFSPKAKIHVRTRSGQALGHVVGIEVDQDTGRITNFLVSGQGVLPMLLDSPLVIAWNQVVEWTDENLVVGDAVVPVGATQIAVASPPATPAHFSDRS